METYTLYIFPAHLHKLTALQVYTLMGIVREKLIQYLIEKIYEANKVESTLIKQINEMFRKYFLALILKLNLKPNLHFCMKMSNGMTTEINPVEASMALIPMSLNREDLDNLHPKTICDCLASVLKEGVRILKLKVYECRHEELPDEYQERFFRDINFLQRSVDKLVIVDPKLYNKRSYIYGDFSFFYQFDV